jgi:hypothetical protein
MATLAKQASKAAPGVAFALRKSAHSDAVKLCEFSQWLVRVFCEHLISSVLCVDTGIADPE